MSGYATTRRSTRSRPAFPFSNVNALGFALMFLFGMAAIGHLQAAYDEFHRASVELQKHLETAPHSDRAETLRQKVESLRAQLLNLVHRHVGLDEVGTDTTQRIELHSGRRRMDKIGHGQGRSRNGRQTS
jgi:hypothetical protein